MSLPRKKKVKNGLRPATRRKDPPAASEPARYPAHDHLISELELELTRLKLQEQEMRQVQEHIENASAYYSMLFNSAPVGYVVLDSVGGILEINQAGATLLRRPREKMVRESFTRFVSNESLSNFLKHLRLCKISHKQVNTELLLRTHDGRHIPVELVSTACATSGRQISCHTAIIDISERHQTVAALQKSQSNYQNLVNSIEGIVWEGNATGEFTFVSRQAERMLGYPVERWLYEPEFWASHIIDEDREQVLNTYHKAVKAGKSFVQEFRMVTAQRHTIWLRNSVNVIREPRNQTKLQGVMVNITELKEAEQALREETNTLDTLNRIGTSLPAELDVEKLVQVVTEAGREVSGAKFGAFSYKHINGNGGNFTLHTTSGAPRETFARLPMPRHDPRVAPADTEKEIIRIDDLSLDPRSPQPRQKNGRPARDPAPPVRSYLAVPVVSRSGEVLGGLLFGHPAPGIFTERAQHLLAGIAAEAGIALDNARLYHAVKQSEAHFRQLADAMPQIVWTADSSGRIDYLNKRWEEFTGLDAGLEANHEGWMNFLHPEDCQRCTDQWREAVFSGQPFQIECRLKEHLTGNFRWQLMRAVPINAESGHISRWFGTSTDIEDQKQAEEKVRTLNTALERRVSERTAQLQASNRELEAFSYSVSHDLRAPLRSINAFSELVREDYAEKLDDQGRQYLAIIRDSSEQMSRLIDDLLHLSRVTRGELRRQPIDLGHIARILLSDLRRLEPKRHVEILIAPDLKASGDERLMRIVLENLLNNAWKFTSKRPEARIEVGVTSKDGQPAWFVRDNGAGFDMAFANRLFGAFQRLHSTSDYPGHGIGLATVQRIISRHGGRIWAESVPDEGTTFFFTLPPGA